MKKSKTEQNRTLLIGIGNTSRADDGLGWLFLNSVEEFSPGSFDAEYRYQLQVEDAVLVSSYEKVFFIDATEEELPEGFELIRCEPATEYFFSSHMQSPETILYLAKTLYNKQPESIVLKISGYEWELGKPLSNRARHNLDDAIHFIQENFILESEASY